MCHTLPRIGYKTPYNRRVESRDSEEGDTLTGQTGLSPTLESGAPPQQLIALVKYLYKSFFNPLFKMTEYDQKQSKEIYEALLDSKVDLLEYFLGPDPRKTSYYKKHVKRYRAQSILNDF